MRSPYVTRHGAAVQRADAGAVAPVVVPAQPVVPKTTKAALSLQLRDGLALAVAHPDHAHLPPTPAWIDARVDSLFAADAKAANKVRETNRNQILKEQATTEQAVAHLADPIADLNKDLSSRIRKLQEAADKKDVKADWLAKGEARFRGSKVTEFQATWGVAWGNDAAKLPFGAGEAYLEFHAPPDPASSPLPWSKANPDRPGFFGKNRVVRDSTNERWYASSDHYVSFELVTDAV